jgi:hypothetical protein
MKHLSPITSVITTLLMAGAFAHASTVYIVSNGLDTSNDSGDPTIDLPGSIPGQPAWAPPYAGTRWISYGPSGSSNGPGYFSPPNGTVVTFTTEFTLAGLITGGQLSVMTDDITSVMLNGHTLYAAILSPGAVCALDDLSCLSLAPGDFLSAALLPYLVDGTNTLSFGVMQVNGGVFGLDFQGDIGEQTPEPATMAIFAGGLICLLLLRRRR